MRMRFDVDNTDICRDESPVHEPEHAKRLVPGTRVRVRRLSGECDRTFERGTKAAGAGRPQ